MPNRDINELKALNDEHTRNSTPDTKDEKNLSWGIPPGLNKYRKMIQQILYSFFPFRTGYFIAGLDVKKEEESLREICKR